MYLYIELTARNPHEEELIAEVAPSLGLHFFQFNFNQREDHFRSSWATILY